jgi:phosphopantothenoylcysteine decarboxylase / phosphopantothenate---cysteine ligase
MSNSSIKSKVLFKMTGSIACYKACNIISKLVQAGFEVQVVTSKSALQFVGQATLEGLTGKPVINDMWSPGNIMDHIHLMRWADLVIVAPATANFINKTAQGVGDDLLTTLFLAHDFKKPYLIAPAMNTTMYLHPATQKSIRTLKEYGVEILETASGVLACGEVGYGKLLDPELIFLEIQKSLHESMSIAKNSGVKSSVNARKILITSGGTQEPIDEVRVITNKSTGKTGARIADTLIEMGANVTFLHAAQSATPQLECDRFSFETYLDLENQLKRILGQDRYDSIIHLAAVSDYSLAIGGAKGKLSSQSESMTLQLKKNPKLLNQLKDFSSNKSLRVVAFKMTADTDLDQQAISVSKLFAEGHADLVIHNDLSEIKTDLGTHIFHWCEPKKSFTERIKLESSDQLALALADWLIDRERTEDL